MPNNPRQQIKHDLDRGVNHIEWIQGILIKNGEVYREFHPEITKEYEIVYAFCEQLKGLLEGLRSTY